MALSAELTQAKQVLSARLLTATSRGRGVGLRMSVTMAAAAAGAGQNVHAVGIGKKIVHGRETDTLGVRLYVTQKIAVSAIAPRDRLPASIDGIPTDVIEAPMAFVAAGQGAAAACTDGRKQRQRPIVAGISTGHPSITAGTIGYFCRSIRPGDDPAVVYAISNNHIFANLNRGMVGDPLYQPGSIDGGTAVDVFATLTRWVHLQVDGLTPNLVDCAIGEVSAGVPHSVECCSIGLIAGTVSVTGGMAVRKHGRTTGYAEGTVTDESIDALVGMDQNDASAVALFHNQIRLAPTPPYTAIGLGGDSGSLVVDASSQNAVGLYFANPQSGEYGYANPIAEVLSGLEIELL
jgi:hypothetical protein